MQPQWLQIFERETPLNSIESRNLAAELLLGSEWNCFRSRSNPELEAYIAEYIRFHARVPGWLTKELATNEPIARISCELLNKQVIGLLYLNAAILQLSSLHKEEEIELLFFVDDKTMAILEMTELLHHIPRVEYERLQNILALAEKLQES